MEELKKKKQKKSTDLWFLIKITRCQKIPQPSIRGGMENSPVQGRTGAQLPQSTSDRSRVQSGRDRAVTRAAALALLHPHPAVLGIVLWERCHAALVRRSRTTT